MAEVPPEGYVLAEEQGEMYFCSARCLCLWAVHFVTNPPGAPKNRKGLLANWPCPQVSDGNLLTFYVGVWCFPLDERECVPPTLFPATLAFIGAERRQHQRCPSAPVLKLNQNQTGTLLNFAGSSVVSPSQR
jgi:hypothetical protein